MPDAQNHSELLRQCYTRWHETKGGSVDDWMTILADEVDFRSLAMGRADGASFTQPCMCKDDVMGYFHGLLSEWDMVHYTVDHFVEQDSRVCAIGSTAWTNKATGKTFDTPKVDYWRFENGKAVSFFEFYDTAAVFEGATP